MKMLGRHRDLPTDKLVLVSQAGFTAQARTLAEAKGAVALEPSDLGGDDPAGRIVNRLKSIWSKMLALTPERAQVRVEGPEEIESFSVPLDTLLFLNNGKQLATLADWFQAMVQVRLDKIMEDMGLRDIAESMDRWFTLEFGKPVVSIDGVRHALAVEWHSDEGKRELNHLLHVQVVGKVRIDVAEVELTHHRLGDVIFSQGTSTLAGRNALVVVTEGDQTGQASIRFGDEVGRGSA